MRLKMASAVEGCLYRRLNVVPGRPSRYSKDRREDADILLLESSRSPPKMLALSVHDRLGIAVASDRNAVSTHI